MPPIGFFVGAAASGLGGVGVLLAGTVTTVVQEQQTISTPATLDSIPSPR
jgi:hypothetical protein